MSFCVSHRTALDKNIRHIYSGVSTDVRFRNYSNSTDAAMDIHDRIWERHKRPPHRFETKFLEYNQDYKSRMPRAPAFRHVNAEEVHEITSRLTRPTLMTVLRQQPAVNSCTSSTSPGRTSSRKTERSDSETPDLRQRKISYKEWSDDGSDVYYIDDSFLEDSSIRHKKKENSGDLRNESNLSADGEAPSSDTQQPHEKLNTDLTIDKRHNRPLGSHVDCNESGNDAAKAEDDKDENQEICEHSLSLSESQSENRTPEIQHSKGHSRRQKLNILEEIIQSRSQLRQRNVHTPKGRSPSPVRERRKLENRGRINNKLSRSPYSEPVLCIGSRPMSYQRQGTGSKKTQQRVHGSELKVPNSSDYREGQGNHLLSATRPQTQAGISRPRQDRLTYKFRPDSRGTAVYFRPTRRSKSAPGYKIHDDRRGIPKARNSTSNSNDHDDNDTETTRVSHTHSRQSNISSTDGRKNRRELEENSEGTNDSVLEMARQSRSTRHQSSKSAKAATTNRETGSAKPRSQSVMASRPIEVSKLHSPRTPDDVRYSQCCIPAVENDLLVRFGVEPQGQRSFYVSNNNSRRYASAAEMEAANRRLLAPTASKLIRDRMRWAPNNDTDLADPVKVIRDTVARKSRKRKAGSCNETAWDVFDMDSDGKREKDDGAKINSYRDYRLTDKKAGDWRGNSNSKEKQGRHFEDRKCIRNDNDKSGHGNHSREHKTYTDRQKAAPATMDFKDRQGAAVVTKQQNQKGNGRATTSGRWSSGKSRSRSISPISKSGSSSGSRSASRSGSKNSKSRSRSRSRSTSTAKSRSRSRSRSTSVSRSRSRSGSRSWSGQRSRARKRSSERSSSQLFSGGYTETELESSEDAKAKAGSEAGDETHGSEEKRGEEHWTPQGQEQESRERSPIDPSANGGSLASDMSSDTHRTNPEISPEERSQSMPPVAAESLICAELGEDKSQLDDSGPDINNVQDKGHGRAGDDFFGRGQENEIRGQERAYSKIKERDPLDGQNATQSSQALSGSDDTGIVYSVQKGYAPETDGGSSYYSTDYNADITDSEEGATKSAYYRVTFHGDS